MKLIKKCYRCLKFVEMKFVNIDNNVVAIFWSISMEINNEPRIIIMNSENNTSFQWFVFCCLECNVHKNSILSEEIMMKH